VTAVRYTGALLLVAAAAGAVAISAGTSPLGRFGGVMAGALLVVVAVGFVRAWRIAYGVAFLLGLFWLWAVVGLAIQGEMSVVRGIVWIAWSVVIMAAAVRATPKRSGGADKR
jgi:hypothetical protein